MFLWPYWISSAVLHGSAVRPEARRMLFRWHGVAYRRVEMDAYAMFPKPLCWILHGMWWVERKTYGLYRPYFWLMGKYVPEGEMIPMRWRWPMLLSNFLYWVTDMDRWWVREFPSVELIETDDGPVVRFVR